MLSIVCAVEDVVELVPVEEIPPEANDHHLVGESAQ